MIVCEYSKHPGRHWPSKPLVEPFFKLNESTDLQSGKLERESELSEHESDWVLEESENEEPDSEIMHKESDMDESSEENDSGRESPYFQKIINTSGKKWKKSHSWLFFKTVTLCFLFLQDGNS